MSKQSERRKQELAKAKAAAKLINSQLLAKNQSAKTKTDGDSSQNKTNDIVILNNDLVKTPWFLLVFGSVFALFSAIFQPYIHSFSIWIGFVALGIYAQALKYGILNDKKSLQVANNVARGVWAFAFICCCILQATEWNSHPIKVAIPPLLQPTNVSESKPEVIPKSDFATKEDITNLMGLLKSIATPTNETENISYPGMGFVAVLRFDETIPSRQNYIFDWGESTESNRISVYLLPNQTLCFSAIGRDATPYTINIKPSFDTFRLHTLMYLNCEFGNAGDKSFLRICVNGKEVAFQTFPDLGEFPPDFDTMTRHVVGADINHQNGSAMMVEMVCIFSGTLNSKMSSESLKDFDEFLQQVNSDDQGFVMKGSGGIDLGQPYAKAFGEWDWGGGLLRSTNGLIRSLNPANIWLF